MISYTIQGKKVQVFPAEGFNRPVVYLHTFGPEGNRVQQILHKKRDLDFTLAAISNLAWDHDMTPWDCPPISKHDTPCSGGADAYLQMFAGEILPAVEKNVKGEPAWRGVSGYSLAGLFAVYAIYQTDLFSRVASMSGSLWFPNFKEYVFSHEMKRRPDCVYLSLGDKEADTQNPFLQPVEENTAAIQKFYVKQGIDAIFHLNPGSHYRNPYKRTADGIEWILKRERTN